MIHELALGAIDELARLQLVREGEVLVGECPHLLKTTKGNFDRRDELVLLERLHEVRERAGVARLLDQVALTERCEDQHGRVLVGRDRGRRLQPVHAGHLDVEDREVGPVLLDELDGFVPAAGLAYDLVPLFLEGLLQVEADDGLVFGDDDTDGHRILLSLKGQCSAMS